ncbi:hypothetical protein GOARA_068_01180 [Gordonia araii NBRC 100433]|uniref:Pullulanase n=1 Tax=Gordonia araii NBRC 100433 TaxID=1073574 RepID=G7H6I2_9ACTN|nr:hypothetical protein [Gordonia araii]NNG96137.1 hypothetical protein [Gordonia araii NBRC 100433]GAB11457.1 hypothetical protein GOARA_068_01180 [Gordonia araii NBRC 100433]
MDPPLIAHTFGTGFGETTTWHAPADVDLNGDGRLESIRLDFDGDGLADDLMIDLDGDGVAEYAALDLDDDGTVDVFYTDAGNGVWGVRAEPPAGPAAPPTAPRAAPEPGRMEVPIDVDGNGTIDATLVTHADGRRELRLDTDGDGRWDTALVDEDGDGTIDRVHHRKP